MSVNKDNMRKWVAALRSGAYKQGQAQLAWPAGGTHCCLGVLCEVAGIDYEPIAGQAPQSLASLFLGVEFFNQSTYAELNDKGATFDEIADRIEKDFDL